MLFLDVSYHLFDDRNHWWNVLLNSDKDDLWVNFKIVMGYLVTHTHDSTPINLWIVGKKFSFGHLVKSFDSFTQGYEVHADSIQAKCTTWRSDEVIGAFDGLCTFLYHLECRTNILQATNTISLSNINPLLHDSLFKQAIHPVSYPNHIDLGSKQLFQVGLYQV